METGGVRLNLSAGLAAVAVSLTLIVAKGWAWQATDALSVAASLIDSALDLLVSGANLAAILYAAKPPDEDHRFGHHSIEDIAALAQSLIVFAAGVALGWRGVERLLDPAPLAAEQAGIAVMVLSVLLTGTLVWWQRRVARVTNSKVVAADSLHYLADLLPAGGSIVALAASALFDVVLLDSAFSLIAAAFLLRGAWRIGDAAMAALMDREAPAEVRRRIGAVVGDFPEIQGFHDLKTRQSGSRVFVQLHIELDGEQSLWAAHGVAAALRRRILDDLPHAEVIVHQDPVPVASSD